MKLDMDILKLIAFTDALFANNADLSSQISYVIVLIDAIGKANIIYQSLTKYKRVIKSVLAIKLYRIAYSFNITAVIKSTIDKMLSIITPLILYTDLKSLFNSLVRLNTTQEKCLIINIIYLHQVYKRREIIEIKWIDGNANPTNVIIKGKAYNTLTQLINTNYIQLKAIGQVKRAKDKK